MASAEPPTVEKGHDPDFFLEEVSDRLICPVCHLVMKDPRVVEECGHHLCGSCLEKVKETYGLCPLDREKIGQTFKDKGRWREIRALKRRCVNFEDGCDWNGELGDYEDHIVKKKCLLYCANGCGNKVHSYELQKHMEKTCPETVVDCPFKMVGNGCDFRAKRTKIKDHVTRQQFQHLMCAATACSDMRQHIWREATQPSKPEDRKTTFDWIIYDFAKKKQEEVNGEVKCQVSEKFYTGPCNTGYCLRLEVYLNGAGSSAASHLSVYAGLCSGRNDATLDWPFSHCVKLQVLNSKTNAAVVTRVMDKRNYGLSHRKKPTVGGENQPVGFREFLCNDRLSASSILATDSLHVRCIVDWSPW